MAIFILIVSIAGYLGLGVFHATPLRESSVKQPLLGLFVGIVILFWLPIYVATQLDGAGRRLFKRFQKKEKLQ